MFDLPVEDGVKPYGQAIFEDKLYEVYQGGANRELFLKPDDSPLPEVRLPNAAFIVKIGTEGL